MFVGHYGVSLAVKGADRRIPLWVLFIATQWLDVIWGPLVAAEIENVRITEGFTKINALDLYYMPYTHSLPGAVGLSLILVGIYFWLRKWRGWGGSALLVGVVSLSHWFVDLPMHVADLPLWGNDYKVGLGFGITSRFHCFLKPSCFSVGFGITSVRPRQIQQRADMQW